MYSVVHNGKVLDFKYKRQNDFTVTFYLDDILIGQILKLEGKYSAVIWHEIPSNSARRHVKGFATRYDASTYMLEACGYHGTS